ncbi:MAG TPA: exodeoxyribonuclease VII large subunit, partial [Fibrobacteria bacterium]|nr:exodeoxyribonuclease VII large subunit [Fibrobacteria bacterium]
RSQAISQGWARWRESGALALGEARKRLGDRARRALAAEAERRVRGAETLRERARAGLEKAAASLPPLRRLLRSTWSQAARAGAEGLALKERLVHAADPARMLELGFAVLKDGKGRTVRSVSALRAGDAIRAELMDGTVEAEVVATKEKA